MMIPLTPPLSADPLERKTMKCDIGSIFAGLERGERREENWGPETKMEENTADLDFHNGENCLEIGGEISSSQSKCVLTRDAPANTEIPSVLHGHETNLHHRSINQSIQRDIVEPRNSSTAQPFIHNQQSPTSLRTYLQTHPLSVIYLVIVSCFQTDRKSQTEMLLAHRPPGILQVLRCRGGDLGGGLPPLRFGL